MAYDRRGLRKPESYPLFFEGKLMLTRNLTKSIIVVSILLGTTFAQIGVTTHHSIPSGVQQAELIPPILVTKPQPIFMPHFNFTTVSRSYNRLPLDVVPSRPTLPRVTAVQHKVPTPIPLSESSTLSPAVQPPMFATAGQSVWDHIAACESSGNWQINTGNGYYGGLQEDMNFWRSYSPWHIVAGKLVLLYARPDLAPKEVQIAAAEWARDGDPKTHKGGRGYTPWPVCGKRR
jgi:hypothetical protein